MATYVLVHGAWHGGWCWKKVTPLLRAAGHEVFTPTLTGLGERSHLLSPDIGLDTHIQDIVNVLEYEDLHGVILVGHSYGGMVITGAADRCPERLAHLLYLDAIVPQDGESFFDRASPETRTRLKESAIAMGHGWRVPHPPLSLWGITSPEDAQWVIQKITYHPLKTFEQPVHIKSSAFAKLQRTFIHCTERSGRGQSPTAQRLRSEKGWRYRELATGHDAMITQPKELADMLLEIA
jgi:pimeloyl-ACP methyl ester carboxylesterase